LRVAIRVENELVEDGRQTATHDGSQPINLENNWSGYLDYFKSN
jgi:hypothetical protein